MSTSFNESSFLLRTKENHLNNLQELSLNDEKIHVRGVKHDSVLNRSKFFHITSNKKIDLMHVLPEGVIPYILSCILYEFIYVRKLLTLQLFNDKVRWLFSVSETDKQNTPPELNEIKYAGGGISPKCTANEMLALWRYVPLILYEFLENEYNKHWDLMMQLQCIVDLAFSPKLNDRLLNHFCEIYEDHFYFFSKSFTRS